MLFHFNDVTISCSLSNLMLLKDILYSRSTLNFSSVFVIDGMNYRCPLFMKQKYSQTWSKISRLLFTLKITSAVLCFRHDPLLIPFSLLLSIIQTFWCKADRCILIMSTESIKKYHEEYLQYMYLSYLAAGMSLHHYSFWVRVSCQTRPN